MLNNQHRDKELAKYKWPVNFHSDEIRIGQLTLGGNSPVRVQSMTNTDTLDIASTVGQISSLADAGCEIVRVTVQGMKEASALQTIKKILSDQGIFVPLVADVHFRPEVAVAAARVADKVRINPGNYSERVGTGDYDEALERASSRIIPMLDVCREHHTVLRVGVNHGSLSARIMERYGNTPEGMAESAMEFLRICRAYDFHDLVVSMKASDVRTMIWSTRLLVCKMQEEGFHCPLHLGVTEAGEGEDGKLKSAIGIGALLEDAIGDTIRVSLTGNPLEEIPFAKTLAGEYGRVQTATATLLPSPFDHYEPPRRSGKRFDRLKFPVVIGSPGRPGKKEPDLFVSEEGKFLDKNGEMEFSYGDDHADFLLHELNDDLESDRRSLSALKADRPVILFTEKNDLKTKVRIASLLIDGLADGVWLKGKITEAFDILQAAGLRVTRTEYIACPSCGRTRFDIVKALKEVKNRTSHLEGLKIAVMGCVVNGPGEMADADYGYVGSGLGKVTIYKGKKAVTKNIREEEAIDELISLIRVSGDWRDP